MQTVKLSESIKLISEKIWFYKDKTDIERKEIHTFSQIKWTRQDKGNHVYINFKIIRFSIICHINIKN